MKLPSLNSERMSELYVDEQVDGSGHPLHVSEGGLTRLAVSVIVDRHGRVTALAEAEAADRFYGVQMDMFSAGDPHGS